MTDAPVIDPSTSDSSPTNPSAAGAPAPATEVRHAVPRAFTRGFVVLLAFALAAFAVLMMLGNWQMRRLAWKEELLATIETRRALPPAPLDAVLATARAEGERGPAHGRLDYRPTVATGRFEPGEALVYSTDLGVVGWQVLGALRLPDGRTLVVNRGFVPDAMLEDEAARAPPTSDVTVTGLLRDPLRAKPNRFVPENTADEFYWKDFPALLARLGVTPGEAVPAILDAGPTPAGQVPVGGQTIVDLPNNHLGYAVTWYGIGVGLVGVVVALTWGRVRRARAARLTSRATKAT